MQAGAGYLQQRRCARGGERYSFGVFRQRYIASDIALSRWRSVRSSLQNGNAVRQFVERELQIMPRITKGRRSAEISEQLNLSPVPTVNNRYRYRMFSTKHSQMLS